MIENSALIRSVEEAINAVHFIDFERNQLMFRGQVNNTWDILPLLYRKITDIQRAHFYELSSLIPLLENINSPYVPSKDLIEQLMTSQHFGHPTRLVDWTNDVLVGLFFACYDEKKEHVGVNGRLTLMEKSFLPELKVNERKRRDIKNRLKPEQAEESWKELQVKDISILEPMIKNPRMRVQDGLFTIFPWTFGSADSELLTLNKYIREQRKFVDANNKSNEDKLSYIFVAHKDIDKNFKSEILKELDKKYGISEESLFIKSNYSDKTEKYFSEISEFADQYALGLFLKASLKNKSPSKEQIIRLKKYVDSIIPDIQKFNGNPIPAIIEAWIKKTTLILNSGLFTGESFKSELESFLEIFKKNRPDQSIDIGKRMEIIQKLVENEFTKFLK